MILSLINYYHVQFEKQIYHHNTIRQLMLMIIGVNQKFKKKKRLLI